jgi:hypothetical protein
MQHHVLLNGLTFKQYVRFAVNERIGVYATVAIHVMAISWIDADFTEEFPVCR